MKTVVVISDSHNSLPNEELFWQVLKECDYIIHLGDGLSDQRRLQNEFKDKVIIVSGNCDPLSSDPFKIVEIENIKFLITHGHKFSVKQDLFELSFECEYQKVKYGLYGHTHIPKTDFCENGVTLINPGSISFTRSYCYIIINGDKLIHRIVNL